MKRGSSINVVQGYVNHRNQIGLPYEGHAVGGGGVQVNPNPEFGEKDFIVLSIGGNDFAKRFEDRVDVILEDVRGIIQFYKERGIKANRMFYMTPYPPTGLMKGLYSCFCCKKLMTVYDEMIT